MLYSMMLFLTFFPSPLIAAFIKSWRKVRSFSIVAPFSSSLPSVPVLVILSIDLCVLSVLSVLSNCIVLLDFRVVILRCVEGE